MYKENISVGIFLKSKKKKTQKTKRGYKLPVHINIYVMCLVCTSPL